MYSELPFGSHRIGYHKLTPASEYVRKPYDPSILRSVTGDYDKIDYPYPRFSVEDDDIKREYYFVSGPWFHIPELCFPGASEVDYRMGISRMLALRKPEKPGFSDRLRSNQNKIPVRFRGYIHRFQKHLHHHLEIEDHEQAYPAWLYQPHAKRKLRERVHEDELKYLDLHEDDGACVEYKLKPGELLTKSKKRGIGDLGAKRTQVSAWCIAQLKKAWSVPYKLGSTESRFIASPDKELLTETFEWLMTPNLGEFRFAYFSDDCSFSIGAKDGVFVANGDISQCDGSHYDVIFDSLYNVLTDNKEQVFSEALRHAFAVLGQPLVFKNKRNRREKVKYEFTSKRLYSGSVLTTIVNNWANFLIYLAVVRRCPDFSQITKSECGELYRLAAEDVGYIVKCKECVQAEDLQFLKHSPALTQDGHYVPIVNIGTFFRGFGATYGDLSHVYGSAKIPLEERIRSYLSDVVVSRRNWGNHDINDCFQKYAKRSSLINPLLQKVADMKSTGRAGDRIDLSALAVRYREYPGDIVQALEELIHHVRTSDVGSFINLPVVSYMYNIDYG